MRQELVEIPEHIQVYSSGVSEVLRSTYKNKQLLFLLNEKRKHHLSTWNVEDIVSEHLQWVLSHWSLEDFSIHSNFFQHHEHKYAPLFREKLQVNFSLKESSVSVLREFLIEQGEQALVIHISNAILDGKDIDFRSDLYNGELRIFGSDKSDFRSLLNLAHELGHCQVEASNPKDLSFCKRLKGEMSAYSWELKVAKYFLTENKYNDFLKERKALDFMNHYLFLWELSQHPKYKHKVEEYIDEIFNERFLVLRQTLFCTPGYQAVYSMASRAILAL